MMKDGQILSIQSLDSLVAKAGESQTVNLDLSPVRNHETGEYHLLFSFRLRETLPWAHKGHELGWEQIECPWSQRVYPEFNTPSTTSTIIEKSDLVELKCGDTS